MSTNKAPKTHLRVDVKSVMKPKVASAIFSTHNSSSEGQALSKEESNQKDQHLPTKTSLNNHVSFVNQENAQPSKQNPNTRTTSKVVDLTGLDHPNDKPSRATVYRLRKQAEKQAGKQAETKPNPPVKHQELTSVNADEGQATKKKKKEIVTKAPKKKRRSFFCGLFGCA